ncbi:MAG: hypothetical protein RJA22_350 [Verrucomicrobiota bacterium]
MAAVEGRHWWYRTLHGLVLRAIRRHPRGRDLTLLDAGCGTGGLLQFLRNRGFRNVSGFDRSPEAVRLGRARGLEIILHDLRLLGQWRPPRSVDVLTAQDSLYFLSPTDQAAFLEQVWQVLAPGGWLILNLPAFPAFRGNHDRAVGIARRVTPADLPHLLPHARFECLERRWWPALLAPLIAGARLRQRRRLRRHPGLPPRSDLDLPWPPLNALCFGVTRLETRLPPFLPWGSSLFLVGRRKDAPAGSAAGPDPAPASA